jgi:hypothetical protein
LQPNISNISHPELIDASQLHPLGKVQIHLKLVFRISRHHEGAPLHCQQIVIPHESSHAFVIHQHPTPS